MPPVRAEYLVVSCIDYRLPKRILNYLESRGLSGNYNHINIPGASLCCVASERKTWRQTLEDTINISIKLHGISKVLLLHHEDCGAFNLHFGAPETLEADINLHKDKLVLSLKELRSCFPNLRFETAFLKEDGTVIDNLV